MRVTRFLGRRAAAHFSFPVQQRTMYRTGLAGGALLMGLAVLSADEQNKKKQESRISTIDDAFVDHVEEKKKPASDGVTGWFRGLFRSFMDLFPESRKKPRIPPQLPPQYRKPFVLVLDLEVLLSSNYEYGHGWRTKKRPGTDYFLSMAGQVCEVIVFSRSLNASIGYMVLPRLDTTNAIAYKFFDEFEKDVGALERPADRLLIVTDRPSEYKGEGVEQNVVLVPSWTGKEEDDSTLLELSAFLEDMNRNQNKIVDTRKVLKNLASTGKTVTETYREIAKSKLEKKEEVLSGKRAGLLQ